jgi:hypothetical protein
MPGAGSSLAAIPYTNVQIALGDALTLLGTQIFDGEHLDASRELPRRLIDLICVAQGIDALPSGAPTALA